MILYMLEEFMAGGVHCIYHDGVMRVSWAYRTVARPASTCLGRHLGSN